MSLARIARGGVPRILVETAAAWFLRDVIQPIPETSANNNHVLNGDGGPLSVVCSATLFERRGAALEQTGKGFVPRLPTDPAAFDARRRRSVGGMRRPLFAPAVSVACRIRPCVSCSRRITAPFFSRPSTIRIIVCGVTKHRRANFAFESPGSLSSAERVAHCGVVRLRPGGRGFGSRLPD